MLFRLCPLPSYLLYATLSNLNVRLPLLCIHRFAFDTSVSNETRLGDLAALLAVVVILYPDCYQHSEAATSSLLRVHLPPHVRSKVS